MSKEIIENISTKTILNDENYLIWRTELFLLLAKHKLYKYINTDEVKIILKSSIKGDSKDYKTFEFDRDYVYDKNVTEDMIDKDNDTKIIINNSISDEIKKNLDFIYSNSYKIFKTIEETNSFSKQQRIEYLENELNKLYFDENKTSISMHVSYMNKIFNELSSLGKCISNRDKINYLYNSIPTHLSIRTRILVYENNWNEYSESAIKTINRLKELRESKSYKQNQEIKSISLYSNSNGTTSNQNYNKEYKNKKRVPRCYICHKLGHKADTCKFKNTNKNKNKNKYKNKHKQNYSNNVEANSSGIKDYDYQDAFISNALNEDFNNHEYNNAANSALINNRPRHYKRKNTTNLR